MLYQIKNQKLKFPWIRYIIEIIEVYFDNKKIKIIFKIFLSYNISSKIIINHNKGNKLMKT